MSSDGKDRAVELWNHFIESIKSENRFFIEDDIKRDFIKTIKCLKSTLRVGTALYRARINEADSNEPICCEKMGKPPADRVGNGRANPIGIPYLYTSKNVKTCMAELRPNIGAKITVGKFELQREIKIINLHDAWPPPEDEYLEWLIIFLQATFSKRISSERSAIDYLPYQFISELIKNQKYDGVLYRSSVDSDLEAQNVVLFNDDETLIKCLETELYTVLNIEITTTPALD